MGGMTAGAIAATIMQMEKKRREQEQGGQGYGGNFTMLQNVSDVIPFTSKGPRTMNLEGGMARPGGGGGRTGEVLPFNRPAPQPTRTYDDAVAAQRSGKPQGDRPNPDFAIVRQALNSQDPRTQAHIQEVWSKMTPQQQQVLQERLFGTMSPAPAPQSATISRMPGVEQLPARSGVKPMMWQGVNTAKAVEASPNVTPMKNYNYDYIKNIVSNPLQHPGVNLTQLMQRLPEAERARMIRELGLFQ